MNVEAKYHDTAVADSGVLSYDSDTKLFTANSDERDLIGRTREYSLEATLTDYPKDSTTATN